MSITASDIFRNEIATAAPPDPTVAGRELAMIAQMNARLQITYCIKQYVDAGVILVGASYQRLDQGMTECIGAENEGTQINALLRLFNQRQYRAPHRTHRKP